MVSVCNSCVYASKCLGYCGKGLTTRVPECTQYMEGESLDRYWAPHPGSNFPLAGHAVVEHMPAYRVNGKDYTSRYHYYILNPDPIMGYLVRIMNKTWLRGAMYKYPSDDGLRWRICMDLTGDGITKTTLVVEGSEALGLEYPVIPDTLWWLDPTLSREESVPMYALLIAVSKKCLPAGSKKRPRTVVLAEALAVGVECKGKPLSEWTTAISTSFWGGRVRIDWLQAMTNIREWVQRFEV